MVWVAESWWEETSACWQHYWTDSSTLLAEACCFGCCWPAAGSVTAAVADCLWNSGTSKWKHSGWKKQLWRLKKIHILGKYGNNHNFPFLNITLVFSLSLKYHIQVTFSVVCQMYQLFSNHHHLHRCQSPSGQATETAEAVWRNSVTVPLLK